MASNGPAIHPFHPTIAFEEEMGHAFRPRSKPSRGLGLPRLPAPGALEATGHLGRELPAPAHERHGSKTQPGQRLAEDGSGRRPGR